MGLWVGGWVSVLVGGGVHAGLEVAVPNINVTEEDYLAQIIAVGCVTAAPFITSWW
jgi:hypothetical protein